MGSRKTADEQSKYDDVVLDLLYKNIEKNDKVSDKVLAVDINLQRNIKQTEQLTKEVRETNGNVKVLKNEMVAVKQVVFPEKVQTAKDLPAWWRNPKILNIIWMVVLAFLLLVAAATKFDLDKVPL